MNISWANRGLFTVLFHSRVKIIVGGAPVSESWVFEIGADGYGANAIEALNLAKQFIKKP